MRIREYFGNVGADGFIIFSLILNLYRIRMLRGFIRSRIGKKKGISRKKVIKVFYKSMQVSLINFRFFHKMAKSDYWLRHVCLFLGRRGIIRLALEGFFEI